MFAPGEWAGVLPFSGLLGSASFELTTPSENFVDALLIAVNSEGNLGHGELHHVTQTFDDLRLGLKLQGEAVRRPLLASPLPPSPPPFRHSVLIPSLPSGAVVGAYGPRRWNSLSPLNWTAARNPAPRTHPPMEREQYKLRPGPVRGRYTRPPISASRARIGLR